MKSAHRRHLAHHGRPAAVAERPVPEPAEPLGGEAACLLPWVCPECGRLDEDRTGERCSGRGAAPD